MSGQAISSCGKSYQPRQGDHDSKDYSIRHIHCCTILDSVIAKLPCEPLHVESTSSDGTVTIRATSPSRYGTLLGLFSCGSELLCPQRIRVDAIDNTSGESHLISELRQAGPDPVDLWYEDVRMLWLADGKTLWIIYTSHTAGLKVATAEEFVLQESPPFAHKTGNVPISLLDRLHIPY